jgi:hypothetical protein
VAKTKTKKSADTTVDLAEALEAWCAKRRELDRLKRKHGITDLETELVDEKIAIENQAIEGGLKRIEFDGGHATLVESSYDSRYISTKEDIRGDEGVRVTPLRTIIFNKFKDDKAKKLWLKITRRVVVPHKLEQAIAEGHLTIEEVAAAFVEKAKKPYLRVYEDGS